MAFLVGDNFNDYATADILTKGWQWAGNYNAIAAGEGPYGESAMNLRGTTSVIAYRNLPGNYNTLIMGVGVRFTGSVGTTWPFLILGEPGVTHVDLRLNASNRIVVTRAGTVLETTTFEVIVGARYRVEIRAKIDDGTDGTWEVRVGEVQIAKDVGGGDTRNANNNYVNRITLGSVVANQNVYFDNLYICDTSGATCNDFLGDVRGITQFANADGSYTDWTASDGDRHDCINKATPTVDAKYISDLTPGNKCTFSFPALGVTGAVKAVVTNVYASKDDAGTRIIKPISKSGASEGAGAEYSLSASGLYLPQFIEEVDPATGVAWEVAGVDAEEVGVEMVS